VAVKVEAWNRFVSEALVENGESNVKRPFGKLTKKYGLAYIEYLQAAWQANADCLTVEGFLAINGGVPRGFFDKKVKASRGRK
jgi:hypothetical protein